MEANGIKLVVGLGNPGPRYARTRHNIGFLAVERYVGDRGESWACSPVGEGEAARVLTVGGRDMRLVKPHTFMNASGDMVAPLAQFFKIAPSEVLVVSDDFNLPLGTIRIRLKGSAGGQKGLDSILTRFGTQAVPRIRLGIGPVPGGRDPADFVLGRFSPGERDACAKLTEQASRAIGACCDDGVLRAMNVFNGNAA